MPSLIGGLASVIVAYYKCSVVQSDVAVYGEGDKSNQWEMQLAGNTHGHEVNCFAGFVLVLTRCYFMVDRQAWR